MNRRFSRCVIACCVASAWIALLACSGTSAPTDPSPVCPNLPLPDACPSPAPSWKTDVQPLFAKYCDVCHTNGGPGQVTRNFSAFQVIENDHGTIGTWVAQCKMPMPGSPQPTLAERLTLVTWALTCQAPDN
jgi:hypothetical protein